MPKRKEFYTRLGNTFGGELLKFAKSVDIVFTEKFFQDLKTDVVHYLKENFNIMVLGHLVPDLIMWGSRGLIPGLNETDWTEGGVVWGKPIKNEDGSYFGQVSYAYGENQKLWIVSGNEDDDKDFLTEGGNYKNLFDLSLSEELPDFVPSNPDLKIRTSILLPLLSNSNKKQPIGVINFESTERLIKLDILLNELEKISEAIGILFEVKNLYNNASKGTNERIRRLSKLAQLPFWGKQRRVFFAYPQNCDTTIIETVEKVFKRDIYKEKNISLVSWQDIHKGSIMDEIWKLIDECQAGICYFSEINQGNSKERRYSDNLNVLYEAGMMHTLEETRNIIFKEWLLLREKDSPSPPFDISGRNRVEIDRDSNDNISKEEIKKIEERVVKLIEHTFF